MANVLFAMTAAAVRSVCLSLLSSRSSMHRKKHHRNIFQKSKDDVIMCNLFDVILMQVL